MVRTLERWQIEKVESIPGFVEFAGMTPAELKAFKNGSPEEKQKMLDAINPDWQKKTKTAKIDKLTPAQKKKFFKLKTAEERQNFLDAVPDGKRRQSTQSRRKKKSQRKT